MIKIAFFGTQDFGAAILETLVKSDNIKLAGVFTQPDRASGRKQEITVSPVKKLAKEHMLDIYQPESLKNNFPSLDCDLYVVCQYGLIIPKEIIYRPKFGSINIHTSLLPKYRGASPIQSALIAGEQISGITVIKMDEKMDHGEILSSRSINISPDDNYHSLSEKMKKVAQELTLETIHLYTSGKIDGTPQDESKATYCKILTRDDGRVSWNNSNSKEIYNLYRGLNPWPGIWTTWNGKRIKLLEVLPSDNTLEPGKVLYLDKKIYIGTKSGSIEVKKLQLEGKKPMDPSVFASGYVDFDKSFVE